ncbi:MAG: 2-phosphosulfolactate phosphatase [Planctomycetaceae bacterium]|nr:2-phosphosulfolactate phosphatase [Planctomycetales bacterium]MCB9924712.1 2-phosphosulfolactate phosphatase [Planctomycetaceae bacterium]
MPRTINVHFLPELVDDGQLTDKTVVVIDVLRATTTIAHAIAAGAICVIPCLEVDEARRLKSRLGDDTLLGGERGGKRIEGFDFGNSPSEYTPTSVGGKTLIFTTTNGTRAMKTAERAARVVLAGFVNLSAVCDSLATEEVIEIVCAGTNRKITREDVLLAGAIAEQLGRVEAGSAMNDQATIAIESWTRFTREMAENKLPLHESLRNSYGARNLIEIGLERDIEIAAQLDKLEAVPELDLARWRITLAK